MTNEKAISIIKNAFSWYEDNARESEEEDWSGQHEALRMAIKALEQQPTDAVSRSELQKTMDSLPLFRFVNNDHEEADDYYNCESVDMVIRNLPSVTPRINLALTSQDCISRQKALDCFEQTNTRQGAKYAIETLPSVTPKRPKGKWIFCYGNRGKDNVEKCSCCKSYWKEAVIYRYDTQEYLRLRLKYCPKCGAEMEGEEDANNN